MNPLDTPNLQDWARDFLLANCIIVHVDWRLYMPAEVVPDMFLPHPPQRSPSLPLSVMEGPSRIPDNRNKGKQRMVYLEDLEGPVYNTMGSKV
jgi:hypothetical protein